MGGFKAAGDTLKHYSRLINQHFADGREISSALLLGDRSDRGDSSGNRSENWSENSSDGYVKDITLINNTTNNPSLPQITTIEGTIRLSKHNATSGIFIAKFRKKMT